MNRFARRLLFGRSPADRTGTLEKVVTDWRARAPRSILTRRNLVYALGELAAERAAQGQHDAALAATAEAVATCRDAPAGTLRWPLAGVLNQRARLLAKRLPQARDELRETNAEVLALMAPWLDSASRRRRTVLATTYHLQGVVFMSEGDHLAAARLLVRALKYATSAFSPVPSARELDTVATSFLALGRCFAALDRTEQAARCERVGRECRQSTQDIRRAFAELRASWAAIGTRPPMP